MERLASGLAVCALETRMSLCAIASRKRIWCGNSRVLEAKGMRFARLLEGFRLLYKIFKSHLCTRMDGLHAKVVTKI